MEILFRRAGADDIPQMCSLLSELFSIELDFSPDRHKQARGLSLLIDDVLGSSFLFVAAKGAEVVGMCSLQRLISTAEGGSVGLIEDLIVRKDYRGKGIGSGLLSEIIALCEAEGISRLQLLADSDNDQALKFYAAIDWAGTNLVCMRKTL